MDLLHRLDALDKGELKSAHEGQEKAQQHQRG